MDHFITGTTRLGGLLGSPVSHSISPMMHNTAFRALGIDCVYLCFETRPEDLSLMVSALRAMNVYGFNLTMPLKTAVLPCLDDTAPAARLTGAVNTVVNEGGKLIGHNTDGLGFFRALEDRNWYPRGSVITVLGAGGAARAILAQAVLAGAAAVHVICRRSASWDRTLSYIRDLRAAGETSVDLVDSADDAGVAAAVAESSLLVNATPVGMAPGTGETPFPRVSLLREGLLAADVIYHPRKTRFLLDAEQAGCRCAGGLGMLLYQGAAAFEIWTGRRMPVPLVKAACFPDD